MKSSFVLCFTYGDRKCSIQICSSKRQNSGSSRYISLKGPVFPNSQKYFSPINGGRGGLGYGQVLGQLQHGKGLSLLTPAANVPMYDCSLVSFSSNCRYIQDIVHSPLTNALQFHPHLKRSSITHKSLQYNYNNSCTYVKQRRPSCLDLLSTYSILHDI